MTHYSQLVRLFDNPNGLCSSITESKHIKAVKEPWRRSNQYHALLQMLITNKQLNKLAAGQADFLSRGMLNNTVLGDSAKVQGKILSFVLELSLTTSL